MPRKSSVGYHKLFKRAGNISFGIMRTQTSIFCCTYSKKIFRVLLYPVWILHVHYYIISATVCFSASSGTLLLLLLLLLSHFSHVRLCVTPKMAVHQAPPSLGFCRQEHWSGLPVPSPMHESEKWNWSRSVVTPRTVAYKAPPSMGFSRQ